MSLYGQTSRPAAWTAIRSPATGRAAIEELWSNPQIGEFFKYGIVSGIALAVDFGTLTLCTELLGLHYLTSAAIGFGLGVIVAYTLSVRWVFKTRALNSRSAERVLFVAIGLAGLALNHATMYGLTELAAVPYQFSKLASAILVFSFNFGLRKLILFRAPTGNRSI